MSFWDKRAEEFLIDRFKEGLSWPAIRKAFIEAEFDNVPSKDAIRMKGYTLTSGNELTLEERKKARRVKINASKVAKEGRAILDGLNLTDDIMTKFEALVKKVKTKQYKPVELGYRKDGCDMIIEVLLSDLHFGKKTKTFNYAIARRRIKELGRQVIMSVHDKTDQGYNVVRLDIALMGDIIESSTMHGEESLKSCEFGNSEQMVKATDSLFHDFLEPVLHLGIPLIINGIPGNHERTEKRKTFKNPGREYMSFVIYNFLKMLIEKCYPTADTTFNISDGPLLLHKIFNDNVLYEHGDLLKAGTKNAMMNMLAKRCTQLNTLIEFYRVGHLHETTTFDRGRVMINGCLPGQDDYSEAHGFRTEASQTINFYCENKNRPNSFYYSYHPFLGSADNV